MIRFAGLSKIFTSGKNRIHALQNVSFDVPQGSVTAVVGESGSGKSTLARVFTGLYQPNGGYFAYGHLMSPFMSQRDWRWLRRRVAMVFQDPYSSLNPRLRIEQIVSEPLLIHRRKVHMNRQQRRDRVIEVLEQVGLNSDALEKYPHEFSGGQRQRIGIARALVLHPEVLVLDEPISALDVSIQAQVLNLLSDLRHKENLTYLFIAHDLGVIEYISDYTAVMYAGRVVEYNQTAELFRRPRHPYTMSLLDAMPSIKKIGQPFKALEGETPSPIHPPPGCPFAKRCFRAQDICQQEMPQPSQNKGGFYYCHNPL